MEERRAVHPLVHVVLRHIGVPVEVDDADIAVDEQRQSANIGVSDRVVAAEDDREDLALVDVGDGLVDLVEALLDIGRDYRNVADIDDVQRLRQVNPHLETETLVDG